MTREKVNLREGRSVRSTLLKKIPPGAEITVIGTFDSYREEAEDGNYYIYLVLRNAKLL